MKIQRFSGEDVRQTIRKVRDTLGPDAVILSNARTDSGVEIVAAIEYDESLFGGAITNPYTESDRQDIGINSDTDIVKNNTNPSAGKKSTDKKTTQQAKLRKQAWEDVKYSRNIPETTSQETSAARSATQANQQTSSFKNAPDTAAINHMESEIKSLRSELMQQLSGMAWERETKFHPARARLVQRLISLGLSPSVAKNIASDVEQENDFDTMWRQALGVLSHRVPVLGEDLLRVGGIISLVGPTGVGKTTTIAKLASRYALKHGRDSVGLISTDDRRVAAQEQLRGYSRILGVPMRTVKDAASLNEALHSLRSRKFILIDTAGMSLHDEKLSEQLSYIKSGAKRVRMFLCLDASSQRSVLQQSIHAFGKVELDGCIVTKLDETTSLGGAMTVACDHHLPVSYYCDGQKIPDDIHIARAHNLVSRAVTIMQNSAKIQDASTTQTVSGMVAHAYG